MILHGACAARSGNAVLLLGPSGAGKSNLLFRLIDRGFTLVADDQVHIENGQASPPERLAGLLEIRGLGIVRLPFTAPARVALVVRLQQGDRLPAPARYHDLDLPMISVDPWPASAPAMVELALDAILGNMTIVTGAFG